MTLRGTFSLFLLAPSILFAAEKPAVVELFEDDADTLIPQLTQGGLGGGDNVRIEAEKGDLFSGIKAIRVAPMQRFNPDIKGWSFPVVEKPKEGEFRYIRFAWKKLQDGPIMIQFCSRETADWGHRYHAGGSPPWPARELTATPPAEWIVHTCDLFKDFGAFTVAGIALSPLSGGEGLYDHILLGRSVEDLDKATTATILKADSRPSTTGRLRELFAALGHIDESIGETARWSLLASRKHSLRFLLQNVTIPERNAIKPVDGEKVKSLVKTLSHFRYVTRESAAQELLKLGEGIIPHIRKATEAASDDEKARLNALLARLTTWNQTEDRRLRRCVKLLRAMDTPDSKELLRKIEASLP